MKLIFQIRLVGLAALLGTVGALAGWAEDELVPGLAVTLKNKARVTQWDATNASLSKGSADLLALPGLLADRKRQCVEVLAERILGTAGIEGLTLVGGEPFFQAKPLAELSRRVRAAGLSVMAYSGFTLEQLQSDLVPYAKYLLREIDLLMDGPFRADLPTRRPWRGSDNQRLLSLSHRYGDEVAKWDAETGQQFEVRISPAGELELVGLWPSGLIQGCPGTHTGAKP